MTVEHLLLAIIDTPKVREILRACGADARAAAQGAQGVHRADHAAPEAGRRARGAADARLPARAAARRVPRAVERQEGSVGRQRAGRDLQREALARGLPARPAGHLAARRRQLTSRTGCRSPATSAKCRARRGRAQAEGERDAEGSSALEKYATNLNRARPGGPHRPADRPPARDRAHHRDPVPAPQEQPALRRRGRRRQDRAGRGPRAHDRRGQGAGRAGRQHRLLARPGLADRRHQVSRRFREAPEGRARRDQEAARARSCSSTRSTR